MHHRRTFIKTAAAGLTTLSMPHIWSRAQGANSDIRVAVVGTGGRGSGHLGNLLKETGVRVTGVCDVDGNHAARNVDNAAKKGHIATAYTDYRKLLEDKNIDAIMIATPNHTHTLIAMCAIAAGKHVYVEKPVSHNVWEGRKFVEFAAKHPKIIVQHGMQRRSDEGWAAIREDMIKEAYGKIQLSRGLNYKARQSIGKVSGPQQPPAGVDYDLWSGPREIRPIMREKFHYDWHWQWPYGNGDIGNQGPHQLDVARWMIGQMKLPPKVLSIGGRFGYEDDGDAANTQIAVFDYSPVRLIFDNRGLPLKDMNFATMGAYKEVRIGNVVHCENGYIAESKAYDNEGKLAKKYQLLEGPKHLPNWLNDIRRGKQENENLNILQGHLSGALAHLANLSYRIGKVTKAGEISERIKNDANATELFELMKEHLGQNKMDVEKQKIVLGATIGIDPDTEQFTGEFAEEAKKLDMEEYRDGYKLPV